MRLTYTSILHQWDPRHGGGQRNVHDLAVAMAERGHTVSVLCSASTVVPPGGLPYRTVVVPHHERLYLNPLEFRRAFTTVRNDTDVVHSNGYEGALLKGVLGNAVTFVATTHHPDPPLLNRWPPLWRPLSRLRWYRRLVIALLERRSLRTAPAIV